MEDCICHAFFVECSLIFLCFYKKFLSLVGASICVILGFILPSYFHLQAFERSELRFWEIMLDYFLFGFGVLFGILGTYQSFVNLMTGEGGGH